MKGKYEVRVHVRVRVRVFARTRSCLCVCVHVFLRVCFVCCWQVFIFQKNVQRQVKYFHCRPVKVFFTHEIMMPCKFLRETKFFEEEYIFSSR